MTITRPATANTFPSSALVQRLRRWTSVGASTDRVGRRAQRQRRRTPFASLPAPALAVWEIDRAELAADMDQARW